MKKIKRTWAFVFVSLLLLTACQKNLNEKPPVDPQAFNPAFSHDLGGKDNGAVATDWYSLQLRMILQAGTVPPMVAIRLFAYSGVSLFEAARFEINNSKSLHGQLDQLPIMPLPNNLQKYSWVVSANAAMAGITRDLFPVLNPANSASIDSLEQVYNNKYVSAVGAEVVTRSQAFGDSIASAVFNWSKSDLFNHINDPYTLPTYPGAWIPTPPAFATPLAPHFGDCRTFLHIHEHGLMIPPPFKFSTQKGTGFYAMANHVYSLSKSLTVDQKNMAFFWNDSGPGSYTPQGHDVSIITQVLVNTDASLATAAEAYMKAGIAMWDGVITCFRSKYQYSLLRPVSYIRENIDTSWLPLLVSPPLPEYGATHAYVTAGTMEVMASIFGRDYHFTDHTFDYRGFPSRNYTSFYDASRECGVGLVYGGIEYQESVNIGYLYGLLIGRDAASVDVRGH